MSSPSITPSLSRTFTSTGVYEAKKEGLGLRDAGASQIMTLTKRIMGSVAADVYLLARLVRVEPRHKITPVSSLQMFCVFVNAVCVAGTPTGSGCRGVCIRTCASSLQ